MVWNSSDGEDGDKSAIKAQLYDEAGGKINGEFLVNSVYDDGQSTAKVAALANGGFVITWTSADRAGADTENQAIKARIYDGAGAAVDAEFLVNRVYVDNQLYSDIAVLSDGKFVIVWESGDGQGDDSDGRSVKAQVFDETGKHIGQEYLVNQYYVGDQNGVAVTAIDDGGFIVSWTSADGVSGDASGKAVKAQIFRPASGYDYDDGESYYFDLNVDLQLGAGSTVN